MHASIRRYRVIDAEALITKFGEEFVERARTVEGFVGYYVVDGDDDTITTITLARVLDASAPLDSAPSARAQ